MPNESDVIIITQFKDKEAEISNIVNLSKKVYLVGVCLAIKSTFFHVCVRQESTENWM